MQLNVNNVTKSFGEKEVLKGISFEAQSGRALGLLGRNGAGKTTTIRIIMKFFHADSGSVTIDGEDFKKSHVRFGYMPEERGLYPKLKIHDQLMYLAELSGLNEKQAKENVDILLKKVQLEQYANKKLKVLSKGNQQKIQLVATLVTNPDIIILDEPFSGLDPVNSILLENIIKEEIDKGKIVLFSGHQLNYIEKTCDDIAIINDGKIVLSGDIQKIKYAYSRDRIDIYSKEYGSLGELLANSNYVSEFNNDDEQFAVWLKDPIMKNDLFKEIASNNIDIDNFGIHQPTLNEIFVEYTKEEIR
ncbi:MAG: ATP-binding cassette domain-containing protein [Clostridia bacterium]|nr:ATP-binding cassette domain-containing protein [Clostridia bacterium]